VVKKSAAQIFCEDFLRRLVGISPDYQARTSVGNFCGRIALQARVVACLYQIWVGLLWSGGAIQQQVCPCLDAMVVHLVFLCGIYHERGARLEWHPLVTEPHVTPVGVVDGYVDGDPAMLTRHRVRVWQYVAARFQPL
jgi:hypothetical protein